MKGPWQVFAFIVSGVILSAVAVEMFMIGLSVSSFWWLLIGVIGVAIGEYLRRNSQEVYDTLAGVSDPLVILTVRIWLLVVIMLCLLGLVILWPAFVLAFG